MLGLEMSFSLKTLRALNVAGGADVWLIAGGKSLDFIDPSFFDGKLTVGVNFAYRRFPLEYLVVHNYAFFEDAYRHAAKTRTTMITTKWGFVNPVERRRHVPPKVDLPPPVFTFECEYPLDKNGLDLNVVGTDAIVAGMSTTLTAMHVSAYLGAKSIILCGTDGGLIDGESHFVGYREGPAPNVDDYPSWLRAVEEQMAALRQRLFEVYGCQVYSLNPFLNFGLEGHQYRRS